MDKREFFNTVALMREAQKDFFKTRSKESLRLSKVYEKLVDEEIERVKGIVGADSIPSITRPTSLFGK